MKLNQLIFLVSGSLFASGSVFAQHNHMDMSAKKDTTKHEMHGHSMEMHDMNAKQKPDSMDHMKMQMNHIEQEEFVRQM